MSTIEIVKVDKGTIVATGERFLEVKALITDGGATVERNYSFAIDATAEAIQAELDKALALYEGEKEQATANAEREAEDATADDTIAALTGGITSAKDE